LSPEWSGVCPTLKQIACVLKGNMEAVIALMQIEDGEYRFLCMCSKTKQYIVVIAICSKMKNLYSNSRRRLSLATYYHYC
jgi:hypothetical protein